MIKDKSKRQYQFFTTARRSAFPRAPGRRDRQGGRSSHVMAGRILAICALTGEGGWPGLRPTACTDLGNDPPRPCLIPSWPGLSGPSVAAGAGTGGPDKPGHDDGETLAAIEQAFDFMGFHGCFRNVCIP